MICKAIISALLLATTLTKASAQETSAPTNSTRTSGSGRETTPF